MPLINLRQMEKLQSGTIISVKVGGELGQRIREMGLVPGTEVTIQGRAPLKYGFIFNSTIKDQF